MTTEVFINGRYETVEIDYQIIREGHLHIISVTCNGNDIKHELTHDQYDIIGEQCWQDADESNG